MLDWNSMHSAYFILLSAEAQVIFSKTRTVCVNTMNNLFGLKYELKMNSFSQGLKSSMNVSAVCPASDLFRMSQDHMDDAAHCLTTFAMRTVLGCCFLKCC